MASLILAGDESTGRIHLHGGFDLMKARHELWMAKYPNTLEARDYPLQGLENPRPEIQALGQPRVNGKDLPFNPLDVIEQLKGWEGVEFDQDE